MSRPFRVVVPARYASTRLPAKPLADIHGKPMAVRVAEAAHASGAAEVWVATDDVRIEAAVRTHGQSVLMTRGDHASGTDRLAEVVDALGWPDDACVVNVQGDEPLIDPALVLAVAQLLDDHPQASVGTAAHPISAVEEFTNPHVVKVVTDAAGLALYFSRAPIAWWRDGFAQGVHKLPTFAPLRHIGIYAYRVEFLRQFPSLPAAPLEQLEALEQLRALWHGYRIAVHQTPNAPGPGVDTPEDLLRVRRHFEAA